MNHHGQLNIEKLFFITRDKNLLDLEDCAYLARLDAKVRIFCLFIKPKQKNI